MQSTYCPGWRTLADCVSACGTRPSSSRRGPWRRRSSPRLCCEHAHFLCRTNIQMDGAFMRWHMSQVHTVTLTALRRTTLSDPRWDVPEAAAPRMKHLRKENPNETDKWHKT